VSAAPRTRPAGHPVATSPMVPRGPIRREEWIRRVRAALGADYTTLPASPLCELPGVLALARSHYARRIYPSAAALRVLLDRAYDAALRELDGLQDRRMHHVALYLQLAREGVPITQITQQLGLRSRSYVHREIQREALELITEAFLQLARQTGSGDAATGGS
jgi:AraC-like DNA-binding protein